MDIKIKIIWRGGNRRFVKQLSITCDKNRRSKVTIWRIIKILTISFRICETSSGVYGSLLNFNGYVVSNVRIVLKSIKLWKA